MFTNPSLRAALAALCLLGAAGGCYNPPFSPDNQDLCHAKCDYTRRCVDHSPSAAADANNANCHTDCGSLHLDFEMKDTLQANNYNNAGAVIQSQVNCYKNDACADVPKCLTTIPLCPRGSATPCP